MILARLKNKIENYFIRNRIIGYQRIDGWLTQLEATGLYRFAARLPKNAVVVEIGTWKGKSTFCIAKGLSPSGRIYAIDPFDASGETESAAIYHQEKGKASLFEEFQDTMKMLGVLNKIIPMKGLSNQFVGKINAIDFLFIDGDHSIEGCDFDFINYAPYLKKYGYIAFHDYDEKRNELGPTWVIKNRLLISTDFKFVQKFDSLWIAQKIQ